MADCCQGMALGEGAWLSDCVEEGRHYHLHQRGDMEKLNAFEVGPHLCRRERKKEGEGSLDQRHRGWREGEALLWCWRLRRGGQLPLLLNTS